MTDEGPAPPAVVLKVNVAETLDLPATRSPAAITNETPVTAPPITPLPTASETAGSALVCTVTLPPPLAPPNVQPASVTVTAAEAANGVPVTLTTMDEAPGACAVRVAPADDDVTLGVADVVKKPGG